MSQQTRRGGMPCPATKGDGKVCGRECKKGEEACGYHVKKEEKPKAEEPPKEKCQARKGDGTVCGKECVGPACGRHLDAHKRDNPDVKLVPTDTADAKAAVQILNRLRENSAAVNEAFLEMFVSRKIFNPAENVNKFVTGGVAEDVIAQLVEKVGFPTTNVAAIETVIDIKVVVDGYTIGISLKNSGSISQQPILENYRGESKAEIRELPPTLIIYTEPKRARIVYLDHAIMKQAFPDLDAKTFNATVYNKKEEGDKQSSLSFKSGFLASLIPKLPDEYIVNATVPEEIPEVPKKSITLLALEYVRAAIKETRAASENESV